MELIEKIHHLPFLKDTVVPGISQPGRS
uniref:Uncharacterized protein n=1 Tax=Arundo donax TaxID=35708 RepID=A0A0A9HT37_ARUDO